MEGVFFASDSTNSTLLAMENFLLQKFIVEELADITIITCKFSPTAIAVLLNL
jgi:hypothetical protein